MANEAADPFVVCARREQREIVGRVLSRLRVRERQIVILYYRHKLTMNQIAGQLGVDAPLVSQIHSAAMARLKAGVHCLVHLSAHDEGVE